MLAMLVFSMCTVSCDDEYDDKEVWNSIHSLESRMDAMETVMNALKNNLYIKSVDKNDNGYVITFTDGSQAAIANGTDGKDGINGKDGKDGKDGINGNDGKDGINGKDGKDGKDGIDGKDGKDGDTLIDRIEVGENDVMFYLTDGRSFSISLYSALTLKFDIQEKTIVLKPNSTFELNYTIESIIPEVEIEVLCSGDFKAKIVKESDTKGTVVVNSGNTVDEYSKVVVLASNGEKIVMKSFHFEDQALEEFDNTQKEIAAEGGELTLEFLTNVPCKAEIDADGQEWITAVTRALEHQTLTFNVAPNSGFTRSAKITILTESGTQKLVYNITQNGDIKCDKTVEATSALGLYYNSFLDENIGNYMIKISNIEYDDYGYAMSAGYSFTIDLYSNKSSNVMEAKLPAGNYKFDNDYTCAAFTIGSGYSKIEQTDEQGYPLGEAVLITDGQLTVKDVDGKYEITGYFKDEKDVVYEVKYNGGMVIANKTGNIGSDFEVENMTVNYARYYGQADHNQTANYYISFGTTGVEEWDPTTALGNGWMIRLDLWGDISEDNDNAVLPEGTYHLSEGHNIGDIAIDNTDVAYYFLTGKTPERTEYKCTDAEVNVSRNGSNYVLDCNLTMEDGSKIHFVYNGALNFENRAEKLIGNVEENFKIANCVYMGDQYNVNSDNYIIRMALDEKESMFINIDLSTEITSDILNPHIPDGIYYVSKKSAHEVGTFDAGYLFSGYLAGSNIGKRDEYGDICTYGLLQDGSIEFSRSGDIYTIHLNCFTSDDFNINVTYTGVMPIENKVVGPSIGNVNFNAGYAPFAYYYGERNDVYGDYYYYLLTFSDIKMEGSYNGIYPANTEAGNASVLYVYAGDKPDANGRVPEGTYTASDEKKGFVWDTSLCEGRVYDAQGNRSTVAFKSGDMVVKHTSDTEYNIKFNAKTLRGEDFSFVYNGAIEMNGVSKTSHRIPEMLPKQSLNDFFKIDKPNVRNLNSIKSKSILKLPKAGWKHRFHKDVDRK